jgi:hypothetical protein
MTACATAEQSICFSFMKLAKRKIFHKKDYALYSFLGCCSMKGKTSLHSYSFICQIRPFFLVRLTLSSYPVLLCDFDKIFRRYLENTCLCQQSQLSNLQLSSAGGRLVISSDGVWDALSPEMTIECCRGMPADAAASQIVKVFLFFGICIC